jgi:hypothetical protein
MPDIKPHKALRVLLLVVAIVPAPAGVLLLLGSGVVASFAPVGWQFAPVGFAVVLLKFIGAVVLALAYLSYAASRDPVRNVAFIDAFIFLLIAAAAIDLYALAVLHAAPFYPPAFVVARSIIRLAIAIVLIVLRPRGEV